LIRLEEWVDIVSRRATGQSIKSIARELGISRNTVRATLRREGPPLYARRAAPSKLDAHRDYLIARLAEFPELSAKHLLAEIRAQGYGGGISILKDFTRPYRVPRKGPVVRFETPPGQQAQCDFGELGIHAVRGVRTRVYLFVMVLGFSRYMYVEAVTDARSESFLACHSRAFAYFGGMPREVLYDNAKIVALEHSRTGVDPS
jgi:transposase